MKKIVSALLCIVLIFCTAGIAFADEPVNEDAAVYAAETETRDGAAVAADPVEEISDDEEIIPAAGLEQEDGSETPVEETDPEEAETVEKETGSEETEEPAVTTSEEPAEAPVEDLVEYPVFDRSFTLNDVTVRVGAPAGVFPEEAELFVTAVPGDQVESAVAAERDEDVNVAVSYTYDIKVMLDGVELQPTDGQSVKVSFELAQAGDGNLDATIYHISDGEAAALDTTKESGLVSAETNGFSYYTVEFTYNDLQYILLGGESVALSAILDEVGLVGAPTSAVSSAPDLFSVEMRDGAWTLAAIQAFDTEETLTVTINGTDYVIKVTENDPGSYGEYSLINGILPVDGGYVWMGGDEPIKWQVIGKSDDNWLLISADVLMPDSLDWYDALDYCYYATVKDSFSSAEQAAVPRTYKDEPSWYRYNYNDWTYLAGPASLQSYMFMLSAEEAHVYFSSEADRQPGSFWLRSLWDTDGGSLDDWAFCIEESGYMKAHRCDLFEFGVRPAFQLNQESVLLISAAEGGKSSAETGSGDFGTISGPSGTDSNEVKLTLIDSSMEGFNAVPNKTNVGPGDTIAVKYTGAGGGPEIKYVAAILCNSDGAPLYYASKSSNPAGVGIWHMTIPSELPEGRYILKVFLEKPSGDKKTDYASNPVEIRLNGHWFEYELSEDAASITATCSYEDCPSGYHENGITVTVNAPETFICDGNIKEAAVSGYQADIIDLDPEPEILYYASAGVGSIDPAGEALPGAPSEAGSYVARIMWGGQTASRAFTIAKENAAVTSDPEAKKITYSGAAQELVTAGKASGGTMAYSLTPDGAFTETIPKGTDGGEYTVYYKAVGDEYHSDSAVGGPVNITISPAEQPITAAAGKPSVSVGRTTKITVTGAKGEVTYASGDIGIAAVSSTGVVTAKKVGTVKITASAAATNNYEKGEKTVTIKILPAATASLTAANLKTGVRLSWEKVTGAAGYYIYRNGTQIKKITSGSTLTYTDKDATGNGTKYKYKVVAYASTGTSTLSKTVTIYGLKQPAISSLTNSGTKKMTVKWANNTKGTGYEIHYSRYSSFTVKKTVTITGKSIYSIAFAGLTKGKTYYVRVRTYKTVSGKKYYSAWSKAKSAKIAE